MTTLDGSRGALPPAAAGVAYGVGAYVWWGLVPLYFKAVAHVPALEVLAHRIVWSVLLLGALLAFSGAWREVVRAVRSPRLLGVMAITSVLIGGNWYIFIWAVANEHVREASLGYYINPLLSAVLGMVFLGERPSRRQALSFVIAGVGVVALTVWEGRPPWLALALATSFAFYGLLRKVARIGSLAGLSVETLLLAPVAGGYLLLLKSEGRLDFGHEVWPTDVLLLLAGVVTATPLLWFTSAARRLRLATLGLLQYIAPSLQFVLAVTVFGQGLTAGHLVAFGCIWTALGLYSWDALRQRGRAAGPPGSPRAVHPGPDGPGPGPAR